MPVIADALRDDVGQRANDGDQENHQNPQDAGSALVAGLHQNHQGRCQSCHCQDATKTQPPRQRFTAGRGGCGKSGEQLRHEHGTSVGGTADEQLDP